MREFDSHLASFYFLTYFFVVDGRPEHPPVDADRGARMQHGPCGAGRGRRRGGRRAAATQRVRPRARRVPPAGPRAGTGTTSKPFDFIAIPSIRFEQDAIV